jgi:hypothetical protein
MSMTLVVIAAALQAAGVEVWMAGDDGMTRRFADAYKAEIANLCPDNRCRSIKATVQQARPLHESKTEFAVSFALEGRQLGTSKCVAAERDLHACAVKAAKATRRYLSAVR